MAKKKALGFPSEYDDLTQTHFEILELAEFLLGTKGISGFELKSIATQLGVAPSLIHHYYSSTEELIFDTVLFSYSKIINGIQSSNSLEKDPERVARAWIKGMLDWTLQYPGVCVIMEFPRQVLRDGSKKVTDPEAMLNAFLKEIATYGASNVAFMASAVRALQKGKDFKSLPPAKIAALIATDSKFAMFASVMGFATIGGGLWIAGRRPSDKKNPMWMKLGFDPTKQMQNSIEQFIQMVKKG